MEDEVTEDKENELRKESRKRRGKRMDELMNREKQRKRRKEKLKRELVNGGIDEEVKGKAEIKELKCLYIRSVRKENKKSKRAILH